MMLKEKKHNRRRVKQKTNLLSPESQTKTHGCAYLESDCARLRRACHRAKCVFFCLSGAHVCFLTSLFERRVRGIATECSSLGCGFERHYSPGSGFLLRLAQYSILFISLYAIQLFFYNQCENALGIGAPKSRRLQGNRRDKPLRV